MSRITTTISIARQGPSAFFISVGGPALRRKSSRLVQIFRQDTYCNSKSAVNVGGRAIFAKESVTTIKDAINAIRRQNRSP